MSKYRKLIIVFLLLITTLVFIDFISKPSVQASPLPPVRPLDEPTLVPTEVPTPTPTSTNCRKTDNKNYFVKGTLTGGNNNCGSGTCMDSCYNGQTFGAALGYAVNEWWCDDSGVVQNETVNCSTLGSTGCSGGACLPAAITVTPTSAPQTCVCTTDDTCDASCSFEKYADINSYSNPVKCSLSSSLFSSPDFASADKDNWCKASKRTKGDADGDSIINKIDYFYYVSAASGGKINPKANPDFNGDGVVNTNDRVIIIRTLTSQ